MTSKQQKDNENWERAKLDFNRIKFLFEKGEKENMKLVEAHKKEIKEIVAQKLESDNRYQDVIKEMETYREKERISLREAVKTKKRSNFGILLKLLTPPPPPPKFGRLILILDYNKDFGHLKW